MENTETREHVAEAYEAAYAAGIRGVYCGHGVWQVGADEFVTVN